MGEVVGFAAHGGALGGGVSFSGAGPEGAVFTQFSQGATATTVEAAKHGVHMTNSPTREEVAAQIAATEARAAVGLSRLETAIERVSGDLRSSVENLRGEMRAGFARTASTSTVITTALVTGVALFAALVAVMAYGNDRFALGLDFDQRAIERRLEAPPG